MRRRIFANRGGELQTSKFSLFCQISADVRCDLHVFPSESLDSQIILKHIKTKISKSLIIQISIKFQVKFTENHQTHYVAKVRMLTSELRNLEIVTDKIGNRDEELQTRK